MLFMIAGIQEGSPTSCNLLVANVRLSCQIFYGDAPRYDRFEARRPPAKRKDCAFPRPSERGHIDAVGVNSGYSCGWIFGCAAGLLCAGCLPAAAAGLRCCIVCGGG